MQNLTYKAFKSFFLIAAALLLSSCAINYEPVPASYRGPKAMVVDSMRPIRDSRVGFFQLTSVDGRRVLPSSVSTRSASYGQGFDMDHRIESRRVPAGVSILELEGIVSVAAPIQALAGGMYHVSGEVSVDLQPNQTYYVRGFLSEDYAAVWLETLEGQIVSEKIEEGVAPY